MTEDSAWKMHKLNTANIFNKNHTDLIFDINLLLDYCVQLHLFIHLSVSFVILLFSFHYLDCVWMFLLFHFICLKYNVMDVVYLAENTLIRIWKNCYMSNIVTQNNIGDSVLCTFVTQLAHFFCLFSYFVHIFWSHITYAFCSLKEPWWWICYGTLKKKTFKRRQKKEKNNPHLVDLFHF